MSAIATAITTRATGTNGVNGVTVKNAPLSNAEIDNNFINLNANKLEIGDATAVNTANTVVKRDASGNFAAGTIAAALSGNASTATTLQTSRTISLSGDVTGSVSFNGSANADIVATVGDDSHNHSISTITDEHRLFNNMGDNHGTQSDFNSIANFGCRFVQGSTNGPGTGATQFYGLTLGLGNEYAYADYAMQYAIPRTAGDNYISYRVREGTAWQAWRKISAGYADTAGALTTGNNYQVNSLGVGTAGSGTAGQIRATNSIVSFYSDVRLKENIVPITSALDKVMLLNGVTYNANDLAGTFGFEDKEIQVGVLAQDVEKVLPEAVKPAPFDIGIDDDGVEYSLTGENYKTVQYEKLVPLLIEAIKDLNNQIKELKGSK